MSHPPNTHDPTSEHQTSAVFQPFPTSLLRRLTPSPPQPYLSPIPSSSDISDRRYSDAPSDLSSLSDPDNRLSTCPSRQPDFRTPPPPIHHHRLPSHLSLDHAPISRSTPMIPHRPAVSMPPSHPKQNPIHMPVVTPSHHSHHHHQHRSRLGRAVWRLLTRRRRRGANAANAHPTVSLPVVNSVYSASQVPHASDVPREPNSGPGSCTDSLSALRLRVERDIGMDNMGGDMGARGERGRDDAVGGRPIGDGKRKGRALWWNESGSVGSMPVAYAPGVGRERVGMFGAEREASSFGGYRRVMKVGEGSSVSSCEERDEEGEDGHLYLSRRQMRAMQY
eukprot:GFKZ01002112.1.p1 GENE.GFKZ01002112.1~~GFKZ01002112.1.p1  ORF type:complete len:344 (+),score=53.71 GFKZ01002112.1:26-1033(+)